MNASLILKCLKYSVRNFGPAQCSLCHPRWEIQNGESLRVFIMFVSIVIVRCMVMLAFKNSEGNSIPHFIGVSWLGMGPYIFSKKIFKNCKFWLSREIPFWPYCLSNSWDSPSELRRKNLYTYKDLQVDLLQWLHPTDKLCNCLKAPPWDEKYTLWLHKFQ